MLQIMDTESVMHENSPAPPPSAMGGLGESRGQQEQGELSQAPGSSRRCA